MLREIIFWKSSQIETKYFRHEGIDLPDDVPEIPELFGDLGRNY